MDPELFADLDLMTMLPLVGVVLGAIVLLALGARLYAEDRSDPLDRIRAERAGERRHDTAADVLGLRPDSKQEKLERFRSFLEPSDAGELSEMRLKLQRAGYRGRDAVRVFHAVQMIGGLGMLGIGVAYVLMQQAQGAEFSTQMLMLYILGPGAIGYMGPKRWVNRRAEKREAEIVAGFPDSLDLMLVCVEAGQSMDQSIMRVADELRTSYPALSLEYETVAQQIRAGMDKSQVLRDMADRVAVNDITSFCTTLIQSQTFGTPISDALRVYSAEMRDKRIMRAEEAANKLPVKMTLATMMFTLPPLMVILVGPSVLAIVDALKSM